MGNVLAYKIINIDSNNIFNDFLITQNQLMQPYLFYLIKINKRLLDENLTLYKNNPSNIVNEITVYNVLLKKEYTVRMEKTLLKIMMEGLTLKYEPIYDFAKVLIVSKVIEDSAAFKEGIKGDICNVIIGNDEGYLQSLEEMERTLSEKRAKFYLFDLNEFKLRKVDLEKYRGDDGCLRLGMELEELEYESFRIKLNEAIEKTKSKSVDNYLFEYSPEVKDMSNNIESNDGNVIDADVDVDGRVVSEESKEIWEKNMSNNDIEGEVKENSCAINVDNNKEIVDKSKEINKKIAGLMRKSKSMKYSSLQIDTKNDNDNTSDFTNKRRSSINQIENKNIYFLNNNEEETVTKSTIIHSESLTNIDKDNLFLNTDNSQESPNKTLTSKGSQPQTSEPKIKLTPKQKYSKQMPIYDQIDSNYNYIHFKQESSLPLTKSNSSKSSSLTIKNVILIKSYSLSNQNQNHSLTNNSIQPKSLPNTTTTPTFNISHLKTLEHTICI